MLTTLQDSNRLPPFRNGNNTKADGEKPVTMNRAQAQVVSATIFIALLSVNAFAFEAHYEQWQTRKWDKFEGSIQHIEIIDSCDEDGCTHELNVRYRYVVDERAYYSSEISLVDWGTDSSLDWKVDFMRNNPRGAVITVSVDPADPESSVLLTGFAIGTGALTNFLILSSIDLVTLGVLWRLAPRANREDARNDLDKDGTGDYHNREPNRDSNDPDVPLPEPTDIVEGNDDVEKENWWEIEDTDYP